MYCVTHYKAAKSFHFRKTLRQIQFQENFDKNKCITRGREGGGCPALFENWKKVPLFGEEML